tara:strand:- start:9173 stop:11341 length:2169 start_codon:yes stop_codon:yes gene_type:complete
MAEYRKNLQRIKRNLQKMVDQGGNAKDMLEYTALEGYERKQLGRALELLKLSGDKEAEYGIFKPALHGLTAGGIDEIIGGMRASFDVITEGADFDEAYDQYVAAERLSLDEFERQNKKTSMGSEVAGAFSPLAMPARAGSAVWRGSQALRKYLGPMSAGGVGAGWGGLAGFLGSEGDVTERIKNVPKSASIGAIAGQAVPVAATGGKVAFEIFGGPFFWEKFLTSIGRGDKYRKFMADSKLLEVIDKGGGIDAAESKLKEAQKLGISEMGIPDTSTTALRTSRGIVAKPGLGDELGQEAVETRTEGQPGRVTGHLNEAISEGDEEMSKLLRKEPYLAKDDLVQDRKTRAEEWYNAAFEEPNFESEELEILFDTIPELRKAYATARENANTQASSSLARMFSNATDPQSQKAAQDAFDMAFLPEKPEFTMNSLHQTQKSLKSNIDALFQNPETVQRGRILKDIRNRILQIMDENSENYATARTLYKGDSDLMDAFDAGSKFFTKTASEIRADISGFGGRPPIYNDILEQRMYRKAAADELLLKMNRSADSADLTKKVYSKRDDSELSQKLRAIFPSADAYLEYINRMRIEQRMAFTDQKVRGVTTQAQTTPMEMESEFIDQTLPNAAEILTSPVKSAGRIADNMVPDRMDRSRRLSEGVRDEIAPSMFDLDTKQSLKELQRLREFQSNLRQKRLMGIPPILSGARAASVSAPSALQDYGLLNY